MNINELACQIIESTLLIAQVFHFLETGRGITFNIEEVKEHVDQLLKKGDEILYDLEDVFIGPPEDVDKEQNIRGVQVQWKRRPIYIGSPEDKGDLQSLGDLLRQRSEMQQELTKKLLTHKIEPFIGKDETNILTNLAASILDDTDILEERLRTQFDNNIDNMVKRYRELRFLIFEEKPPKLIINRLKEAIKCYIQGYYQSCAIMCRAVLETAIKERFKSKLTKIEDATLGALLEPARKFKILTNEEIQLAERIKDIGNTAAHDFKKCTSEESYESLDKTKILLNKLYRKT